MSVPMSQVLTTARTYLNDDNATQFPDPVLIPKIQEAHRELQEELWVCGSPIVRSQTVVLAYIAAANQLPNPPFPPLDFLCPTMLWENTAGAIIGNSGWAPITECFYLPIGPSPTLINTIGLWTWLGETIFVSPCAVNRSVIVQYRKQINIPVLATDLIGVLFGESFLAPRAAAIAAGTLGNMEVVKDMTALARENLSKVIATNRGSQRPLMNPSGATGWPKLGGGRES